LLVAELLVMLLVALLVMLIVAGGLMMEGVWAGVPGRLLGHSLPDILAG